MIRSALLVAGMVLWCGPVDAAKKEPRSGLGPCRIGAQALIAYLDDGKEASSDYAHAYGMVETCGPVRTAKAKSVPVRPVADRESCRDLALKMLDELDENRMNRPSFVAVREEFAVKCGPAKGVEPKAPSAN
ncbi:hypothetical protein [Pseudorhodoplanes sp.]|uniref:hypothetical protein n=1 Tax=Pseudorhodoplanes sp. TaxID=1934341 RepID=UPI00391B5596